MDPALVHHYFGTKDDLFVAALELPVDPRVRWRRPSRAGVDGAGRAPAAGLPRRCGTTRSHQLPLLGLVRGAVDPQGAGCSATGFLRSCWARSATALGHRPTAELRMPLVASQMVGLVMLRYVLEVEPLASMDPDLLVATYAPTLQRYLDGDLPDRLTLRCSRLSWIIHHMMNNAVVVQNLDVTRGDNQVLRDLDFEVATGEVTGLLGPSGLWQDHADAHARGRAADHRGHRRGLRVRPPGSASLRDQIGYVTQQRQRVRRPDRRREPPLLRPDPRRRRRPGRRVHRDRRAGGLTRPGGRPALRRPALPGLARRRPARATRRLLVLDEPTVGLDPVLRVELWETFHRLAEAGAAVLVSSHVMDEASRCDRLLLMREGQLIADDTPDGLLRRTGAATSSSAFLAVVNGEEAA